MDEIPFFPTFIFFGRSTLPIDDLQWLCHDWYSSGT
jgi:hypothetical protein